MGIHRDLAPCPRSRGAGAGVRKKAVIAPSLSEIRGEERVPVNWRIKGFGNRCLLIPAKATGAIRGIPVPGGPRRRSLGTETPAPTRGGSGMASGLVSTWGWGAPARRRRAETPDLIAIN